MEGACGNDDLLGSMDVVGNGRGLNPYAGRGVVAIKEDLLGLGVCVHGELVVVERCFDVFVRCTAGLLLRVDESLGVVCSHEFAAIKFAGPFQADCMKSLLHPGREWRDIVGVTDLDRSSRCLEGTLVVLRSHIVATYGVVRLGEGDSLLEVGFKVGKRVTLVAHSVGPGLV